MKADSLRISKVFSTGGDVHYFLPHFQREYAWDKSNWQTLLKDVISIYDEYDNNNEPEHFMGALMVINDGTRKGTVPAFKLVDGQQRLTTISLVLCALGRLVKDSQPNLYKKTQRLLINHDEDGPLFFKVLPTTKYGDRDAYMAIVQGKIPSNQTESRIPLAFEFFYKELGHRINQGILDPERFFIVLTNCLQVVFIDLDQRERPYEIFESLNSKGKPLSQADLVRNYIAMRLPEPTQEKVFGEYWSDIENLLQEKRTVGRSRLGELTAFLRHYLAFRSGVLCNEEHVYARFRDRIEKEFVSSELFVAEIATLKRFAEYYNSLLRPHHESDASIRTALTRLYKLETSTAYPFLLAVYDAGYEGKISREDFLEGLQILENYIVRRYLAGEQTNYLNKMFPTLWPEIKHTKDNFVDALKKLLISKNYPSDNRLRKTVSTLQLYDGRSQSRAKVCLILEGVNRYLSTGTGGHTVLDGDPTIEHIMPQSTDSDKVWQKELGVSWEDTFHEYLNTMGNLTLVTQEWNSSLSNGPFNQKKQRLANHALRLNSNYFGRDIQHWDEAAIQKRADFITEKILEIWPSFGELPVIEGLSNQKPTALVILGETLDAKSWQDIAYHVADCLIKLAENFDEIATQLPAYFSRQPRPRSRELPNGWWLTGSLSIPRVKNLCNQLSTVGVSEEEWYVVFD